MNLERIDKILKKHFSKSLTKCKATPLSSEKTKTLNLLRMIFLAQRLGNDKFILGYSDSGYLRYNKKYHDNNQYVKTDDIILDKVLSLKELKENLIKKTLKENKTMLKDTFCMINKKIDNIILKDEPFIISDDVFINEFGIMTKKNIKKPLKDWIKLIKKYNLNTPTISHKIYFDILDKI